jgi:hypothetical protein
MMKNLKSQSAMEILLTYGWAILIITVVVGSLVYLGVFSGSSLAPKAAPGACSVYRPDGQGTIDFINLVGTCNNQIPQYVAVFNGGSSYISTGTVALPLGSTPRSVFAWVHYTGGTNTENVIYSYGSPTADGWASLIVENDYLGFDENSGSYYSSLSLSTAQWQFVGYTYDGGTTITLYLNGPTSQSGTIAPLNTVLAASDPSNIGAYATEQGFDFPGSIADVQVYNATLSANEVASLYQEGIGGVPLRLNNIVAWWPLNENVNDYSGNLNSGTASNIIYTNTWINSYTLP